MPSVDYARKWKEQNLWLVGTGRKVSENIIEVIVVTERERLIELLKNDNCPSSFVCDANCKYINSENCLAERIADYLLDNGVIVPPVKVGDIVYTNCSMQGWYMKLKDRPYEARVVFIGINGKDNFMNVAFFKNDNMLSFKFSEIGKTVFLTREEAEKVLVERSEHSD